MGQPFAGCACATFSLIYKPLDCLNVHTAWMPHVLTDLTIGHHKTSDLTKGGIAAMTPNNSNSIFTKYLRKFRHSENKVHHVKAHIDMAKVEEAEFDRFRREEYSRIDESGLVYLDYAGAALYPKSLLTKHYEFLEKHTLGNPHSGSPASMLSSQIELQARQAVLDYFDADSEQYMIVFTNNASGGLKLVAEAYPFGPNRALVLNEDSHNSLHGMRKYASQASAPTIYYEVHDTGLVDTESFKKSMDVTVKDEPLASSGERGLVVFTAQSNVTGIKQDLGLVDKARLAGFDTIVDIAALATTSRVSINSIKADAAVVSFYKLFGYPTGIGALIMKQKFAHKLRRPYFGGGTIETVQVPGNNVTMTEGPSRFEDGTTNFLSLPAVIYGLRFMNEHIDKLGVRVRTLVEFTRQALSTIRYKNGMQLVTIHGTNDAARRGGTLALTFHKSNGDDVPCEKIEVLANSEKISLRSGCLCNPAMTAILLKRRKDIQNIGEHLTFSSLLEKMGVNSLGVVRISFGIASNHEDAKKFLSFAKRLVSGHDLD